MINLISSLISLRFFILNRFTLYLFLYMRYLTLKEDILLRMYSIILSPFVTKRFSVCLNVEYHTKGATVRTKLNKFIRRV